MLGFYDIGFGFTNMPKPFPHTRKGKTSAAPVKTKAETVSSARTEPKTVTKSEAVQNGGTAKTAESQPQIDKKYWNF